LVAVYLLLLSLLPPERVEQGPTVCLFQAVFGVHCLGCGMTRAISMALHGRFGEAAAFNQLVFPALFFLLLVLVWDIRFLLRAILHGGPGEASESQLRTQPTHIH